MRAKFLTTFFSVLLLSLLTTQGFAKETEKDEVTKKKTTTVVPKQQTTPVAKEDIKKSEVPVVSNPTTNLQTIEDIKKNLESQPHSAQSMTGEQIKWQVISAGGVMGSSSNYMMSGTVGQTAVGFSTSTNYQLNSGFWQSFSTGGGCCVGIRGNVDGDAGETIDISDLVYLVDFIFTGGPTPSCPEEGNIEGDVAENIDISDLVYLVDFIFTGGPTPPAC